MVHDFHIEQPMSMLEFKLEVTFEYNPNLINAPDSSDNHPLIGIHTIMFQMKPFFLKDSTISTILFFFHFL